MAGLKRLCFSLGVCLCMLISSGCATVVEGLKGSVGISTRSLEGTRKSAIAKSYNYDYFTCYTKVADILKSMGAYVYAQDIKKHMIAIYVSSQDTTPVGIFFKESEKTRTQVEISSPSTYAKEFIAARVFSELKN